MSRDFYDRWPAQPESVQTQSDEPDEPTAGEVLEAAHRRFVGRIREIEEKEPSA